MDVGLTRQPSAMAARVANSTALWLRTGNAPGMPRQTGQTFVLGGAPNRVAQEQKIFVAVSSCTWTSSPMTGSNLGWAAIEVCALVAIACFPGWVKSDPAIPGYSNHARSPSNYPITKLPNHGFTGAFKYFSIGISKNMSSFPLASLTPVMSMLASFSGEWMPPMSKNMNPDWVE